MKIEKFIEKIKAGGYIPLIVDKENGISDEYVLLWSLYDPKAWEAYVKYDFPYENRIEIAQRVKIHMYRMMDSFIKGESIIEFLETL